MDKCTEQRFLGDVAEHQITIVRNDGVDRLVRFSKPGTNCLAFDLVTWQGYLCYTGDMGTYVFRRMHDMFEFFRTKLTQTGGLYINPQYWEEKCVAVDRNSGITEYSADRFKAYISERLDDAGASPELRQAINDEVLSCANDGEQEARTAVDNFKHDEFELSDFWEVNLHEYTYRFIWSCYALSWGVQKYDIEKERTGKR